MICIFDNPKSIHRKLVRIVPMELHEDRYNSFLKRQESEMRRLHLSFGGDVVLKYLNLDTAALTAHAQPRHPVLKL
jgi:hypothetical protein